MPRSHHNKHSIENKQRVGKKLVGLSRFLFLSVSVSISVSVAVAVSLGVPRIAQERPGVPRSAQERLGHGAEPKFSARAEHYGLDLGPGLGLSLGLGLGLGAPAENSASIRPQASISLNLRELGPYRASRVGRSPRRRRKNASPLLNLSKGFRLRAF